MQLSPTLLPCVVPPTSPPAVAAEIAKMVNHIEQQNALLGETEMCMEVRATPEQQPWCDHPR